MRVFGRFLYALIAVGFFLLAFTYSRDLMLTKYLEDVFGASLTDPESEYPKYYYFYSSIPDFHNDEPIIEIQADGYEIVGYEVAQASINNNNELEIIESIYLIIYSDTEDLSHFDYMYLEDTDTDTKTTINLQRFKTLYLLNGVNDSGTVYLAKELFASEDIDKICLVDYDDNVLVETEYTYDEDGFAIKEFMETFYDENNRIPDINDLDEMAQYNIYPNQTHVADDYVHIFYIAMGIYFVLLSLSTYLIYFRKKKKRY